MAENMNCPGCGSTKWRVRCVRSVEIDVTNGDAQMVDEGDIEEHGIEIRCDECDHEWEGKLAEALIEFWATARGRYDLKWAYNLVAADFDSRGDGETAAAIRTQLDLINEPEESDDDEE